MKSILIFLLSFTPISSFSQKIKMDTLSFKDSLLIMQTIVTSEKLKISSQVKIKKIILKIYYNKNGSIKNEYETYNPAPTEIVFFYTVNYELRKEEMFFKFGKKLIPIYAKNNPYQELEIVKLLEHKIFEVDSFSGMSAFLALRKTK